MKNTILAVGADIKNKFLIVQGKRFIYGPEIGDLSVADNFARFKNAITRALKSPRIWPQHIICDLHPGYFSTMFARQYASESKGRKIFQIQHHHAHIASVMYEHQLCEPVIGVAFDGTGFGTDGAIWGGEFLLVDSKGSKRLAHFEYHTMPGGEKVVSEPWRMVLSILGEKGLPFIRNISKNEKDVVLAMLAKNLNCPLTSSAGRLFDAAAALLGICQKASYEAEGPIKLERLCQSDSAESYPYEIVKQKGSWIILTGGVFVDIARDIRNKKPITVIAAKFHNTMAGSIIAMVKKLSRTTGTKKVALSGGVFQNRFLFDKVVQGLRNDNFAVYTNEKNPVNDWNISVGQYYAVSLMEN